MTEGDVENMLEYVKVVDDFVADNLLSLCQELIDRDGYDTFNGKMQELIRLMCYTSNPIEVARKLVHRAAVRKVVKDSTLYNVELDRED